MGKNGKSTKHRKTRGLFDGTRWGGWVGGRGRGPSLLRGGEKGLRQCHGQGAPGPDLSAYARQPARGPTMLAHLVAICWPHVDPCGAKRSEKWEQQKKRCKTQNILMVYLGAMLAYLEGNVGPSWGYVGPSSNYVGPSWGRCLAHLGAMLAHLEPYVGPACGLCWPMLAHVDPS